MLSIARNQVESRQMMFIYSETITLLIVYIFALVCLWNYLNIAYWIKILLTLLVLSNMYNMGRHFIYTRYILWKNQVLKPHKFRYEEELKKP